MNEIRDALRARAELALWTTRKEAHRLRVDELKKKLISEQEDVERMERSGIFSRLKSLGRYDEKLEKEQAEAEEARAELEWVETLLLDADKKIPSLKKKMETFRLDGAEISKAALSEAEKELLDWCERMELAERAAAENNSCIIFAREALQKVNDGDYDMDQLVTFGDRIDRFYNRTVADFLNRVGKMQILEGITNRRGRTVCYDDRGRTLLFLQDACAEREFGIHSFDFRKLKGKLAIADALLWIVFDLENLKPLFTELIEAGAKRGEELLRK